LSTQAPHHDRETEPLSALTGDACPESTNPALQPALTAWVSLLRAHAASTRRLNASLLARHGLTVNDYEVLLHLERAPEGILRRVDLAGRVLLTASGITRLLEGLERAGLVERARCSSDGRVVYARLTDAGRRRLGEAAATQAEGIAELFEARFGAAELEQLAELLARLGGPPGPDSCDSPPVP
jgi:DNA-binding MarR family transcriptional regulator